MAVASALQYYCFYFSLCLSFPCKKSIKYFITFSYCYHLLLQLKEAFYLFFLSLFLYRRRNKKDIISSIFLAMATKISTQKKKKLRLCSLNSIILKLQFQLSIVSGQTLLLEFCNNFGCGVLVSCMNI